MALRYFSEQFPELLLNPDALGSVADADPTVIPTADEVVESGTILLFGEIGNDARAMQLAGVLRVATARGVVAIVAFPGATGVPLGLLLAELGAHGLNITGATPVDSNAHTFDEYFALYGRTSVGWTDIAEGSKVLATVSWREILTAAFVTPVGDGALYVVPFQTATDAAGVARRLLDAVRADREESSDALPEFLAELRLPGEEAILAEIDRVENELAALRTDAASLSRFRHLTGHLSGSALEQLVVDGLNEVFRGSEHQAEDRADLRREDFWVVGPGGDFALGEAKGIGSHVRNEHVNQLDTYRSELPGKDDLPGLLVVNIFRNDLSLERRELPLDDRVVRRAAASNVVVLRGLDLYRLVARSFANEDAAGELIAALQSGGGWLNVDESGVDLAQG